MAEEIIYLQARGGGRVRPHRLPLPKPIAGQLARGYVRRVNEDGSNWTPKPETADSEPEAEAKRPPDPKAPKAEWVGFAVLQGMEPDDAEAMTKADLIDKFAG